MSGCSRTPHQVGHSSDQIDVSALWRQGQVPLCVPHTPCAHDSFANDEPLPLGDEYYAAMCRRFLARCGDADRDRLAAWFRSEPIVPVGTACSGTDGSVLAMQKLAHVARSVSLESRSAALRVESLTLVVDRCVFLAFECGVRLRW